jgi:hypothetical protein
MMNCYADTLAREEKIKLLQRELEDYRKRYQNEHNDRYEFSLLAKEAREQQALIRSLESQNEELKKWHKAREQEDEEAHLSCPCSRENGKWARVRRKELELLQSRSELVSSLEDFFGVPEYQVFLSAEKMSQKLEKLQYKLQKMYYEHRDND